MRTWHVSALCVCLSLHCDAGAFACVYFVLDLRSLDVALTGWKSRVFRIWEVQEDGCKEPSDRTVALSGCEACSNALDRDLEE
jgi:hypothetical protein